ncbi:synaptic vesicular amine transporter-like [Paramacrobiotus metropolitanus]|uniref:synaptic vesicular amine transporter-like n=1 Tax=Paramacrobiotus metropolitanus TaxID=2943436 RepID=UPI0024457B7B|nr:synaptic vesicular amine transporter-like [Paramacrobiotus metropolitanus]
MTMVPLVKSVLDKSSALLRHSHRTTSVIVFAVLMLDNLLLTVVVPIIPNLVYQIDHPDNVIPASTGVQSAKCQPENRSLSCTVPNRADDERPAIPAAVDKKAIILDLMNENAKIGFLFSSKAFVQLLINPFVGIVSARYGYTMPLFFGLCVIFFAALLFAVGSTYGTLFFARSLQGVGSSAAVISGMGLISSRYPDEEDRSKQMGVALSGIAAGVLVGYPFGSVVYDFAGKAVPFLLIAFLLAVLGAAQTIALPPRLEHSSVALTTSTKTLLRDPYILAVILVICASTCAMATLEPCLPLWLMETMSPQPWQLGTAFVPDSIGYFLGSSFFGVFALRVGRWKCAMVGMVTVGISAICLPFATAIWHLIIPHFGIGIGIGVVDASFMPLLALLVDLRHEAVYGSVFAVAQIAVCLAYSLGPLLGGLVANSAGFPFLMRTIGIVNLLISPVCMLLRHVPNRAENQGLLSHHTTFGSQDPSRRRSSGMMYRTLTSDTDDYPDVAAMPKFNIRRKSSVRR